MKTIVKFAAVLVVLFLAGMGSAKADTLQYVLTGPDNFDATWTMSSTPSATPDWTTQSFDAPVSGFTINGVLASDQTVTFYAALPFTQGVSGDNLTYFAVATDSTQSDLFSGSLSSPQMNTGIFNVLGYPSDSFLGLFPASYTLDVTDVASVSTPEASTLLMLGTGLALLAFGLKRKTQVSELAS